MSSIFTNVALPTTLTDLIHARNDALRLISDARRCIDMAKDALDLHWRYLMPRGVYTRERTEKRLATMRQKGMIK